MVMPTQMLEDCVWGKSPLIRPTDERYPIAPEQVQIASFDFRLGHTATALSAAVLPHGEPVGALLERFRHYDFPLEDAKTNQLDRGRTYLIPLQEEVNLPEGYQIHFSPKSSTGRCDVFVRTVCDAYSHYDETPPGYRGRIYLEVSSLSFHTMVRAGECLVQGRIKTPKTHVLDSEELRSLHTKEGIVYNNRGKEYEPHELKIGRGRFYFHLDLDRDVIGFKAKPLLHERLDITRKSVHEPETFWEPIFRPKNGYLALEPGVFYLLATKERVRIPADVCGEILTYETTIGEIRPHYAGFFDNGFGGAQGTNGVLEVRGREVPTFIKDGQPICAMRFEKTFHRPSKLYEGNYSASGPSLSKHFLYKEEAWKKLYWTRT